MRSGFSRAEMGFSAGAAHRTDLRWAAFLLGAILLCAGLSSARDSHPASAQSAASDRMQAAAGEQHDTRLDSVKVHKLYMDGEFEQAIAILEKDLKDTRPYSHADSVFIFKHLGVMYAAQYETREKGKYYMHRLLEVEPTARIMDMYASDMIYMIFKNIQEEYAQNQIQLGLHVKGRHGDTLAANPPPKPGSPVGRKWIWAGAAAVTVAAGVGAYFLLFDDSKSDRVHDVGQ